MHRLRDAEQKAVGYKQSLKAVKKGRALLVYLAKDVQENLRMSTLEMCLERGVPVVEVETMRELGKTCGIQVEASVAAILNSEGA